jgi:hypothetical protein
MVDLGNELTVTPLFHSCLLEEKGKSFDKYLIAIQLVFLMRLEQTYMQSQITPSTAQPLNHSISLQASQTAAHGIDEVLES